MTISRFEELLKELGKEFRLALHIDRHHACSIQLPPLVVQLQLDTALENLYLFSKLVELPPGKFRENVLTAALVANGRPDPIPGTLSYFSRENMLALHQSYPLPILTGERLAGLIGSFLEMGKEWKEAVEGGRAGPPGFSPQKMGPHGLR